ncbi:pilin, putative [Pseudoalteromonas luteoviolacea B = ATCC 29581]|nr:pilin, putative [Pseudoalteromonas luteoviolacea B = ATCC 29581]
MIVGIKMRGFTLLELMVGVAIVAILATLAVPSFVEQIKRDRIVTHANQMQAVYRFARSEAVKRETAIELRAAQSSWKVIELVNGREIELRSFTPSHSSIQIAFPTLQIKKTGEISAAKNVLITDNDNSTSDIRFCALPSGQSWLEAGVRGCA